MTYQPYPTGGNSSRRFEEARARREARSFRKNMTGERPPKPPTLRNAVRLIWVGAALSFVGLILTLALNGIVRTEIVNAELAANRAAARQHQTQLTAAQIHASANDSFAIAVVLGSIGVLLWVWMAWANNQGSGRARIGATTLFGLSTIGLVSALATSNRVSLIAQVAQWGVGLAAIVLLWQRETTQYINFG
jgi:hypothetical protein